MIQTQVPDTIAAITTPPGRGGVGIVRISGTQAKNIAAKVLGFLPDARVATLAKFYDSDDNIIDEGITIFFPSPNSFTGEDVLELQGHGGPVVMDRLLRRILKEKTRLANPGEFSERAFLNNKMDLTQAEAVADLINANSEQAARSAIRSLQGDFSQHIKKVLNKLVRLRMMVEATMDFPEEEIDFLAESTAQKDLQKLIEEVGGVFQTAKQGVLLREGISVVIAGEPNAGKSSLLNCLSGRDSAIVTEIAGTTRDTLREYIHIDGMPLHIIDTAGLRDTTNIVEQEGMRRAWQEIKKADLVLLVIDSSSPHIKEEQKIPKKVPILYIKNKIDLTNEKPGIDNHNSETTIKISAKQKKGIDLLRQHLKDFMGYTTTTEGTFIARTRHINALDRVNTLLKKGLEQLQQHRAQELLAEDLRLAQKTLGEITGEFTSDDLLGEIFSNFCIGK